MLSLYPLAGFLVGVLVGLTGVGGGSLMTPMLVMFFGFAPASAVGTDVVFAAMTKLFGAAVHGNNGTIDWQIVRRLATGSLPAALATLAVLHYIGHQPAVQQLMLGALGGVLVLTALAMLARNRLHAVGRSRRLSVAASFKRFQPQLTVLAGAILGAMVTFTSVGAGALGAVMLLYLYPLRLTPARLVGTDIVHAIPLTVLAGAGHLYLGNVQLDILGLLLLGSVPGILLGSHFAVRVPERLLRPLIAGVLLLVGLKLLV